MPSRRRFLAALSAASYGRVSGANDRVQLGLIGYGLIGRQHVHDFKNQNDAELAAMCDAYQPRLEQGVAACGGRAKAYSDFRRLLDDKNIDAVVVSTPDHWHALMTIMACAAGKDVYVEKPMTLFVREGQWMIAAARRHRRIVQVGTQQRSGPHYQKARQLMQSGHIGKIHSIRMSFRRNVMPGFGSPPDAAVPAGFDYDMWLGPAPKRPYNPHRGLYHFRWYWDYSGGQMTNLGAHQIDIAQWVMNVKGPKSVYSAGGRFALQDAGETPDTQDALFEYPGFTSIYSYREASMGRRQGEAGQEFFGDKGSLTISRGGYEVHPDLKIDPESAIPVFAGSPSDASRGEPKKPEMWTRAASGAGSSDQQFDLHARNFLDCIRTRQAPVSDVESGHQVATACHLANISLRTGRKLVWDAERDEIVGDREAAQYLTRPYRKPWDDVLRSLIQ